MQIQDQHDMELTISLTPLDTTILAYGLRFAAERSESAEEERHTVALEGLATVFELCALSAFRFLGFHEMTVRDVRAVAATADLSPLSLPREAATGKAPLPMTPSGWPRRTMSRPTDQAAAQITGDELRRLYERASDLLGETDAHALFADVLGYTPSEGESDDEAGEA